VRGLSLYILFGPDDFSLEERLRELKKEWDDEESLAINTTLFEARQLSLDQLANACNTLPFLGQKRLVIVEGLLTCFESRGTGHQPSWEEWRALVDYVDRMPSTTVLVLTDGKIGRGNPLLKSLSSKAVVQGFLLLRGTRLGQWLRSRVAKQGGDITPGAVRLLAEFGGGNLWVLTNEIDKLLLYAEGRCIEERDVRQVTSYAREANVFIMVDAILEHRLEIGMRLLHQLLAEGMAASYLLFMITHQLRLVVQAKELDAQGMTITETGNQLGLSPNYPLDKLLRQAASYSMEQLVEVYHKLLETDITIKTGKQKDELALDLLVAELCY
jgi:DNA polymerase-3 subunit delta